MSDPHKRNPVHLSVETMAHDKSKPEILKAEIVAESRLFKVESLHLKFSNGEERVYERMRGGNRGAVMVVPLFDAHTLLLVREYAAGTHSYELGFPKGLVDPGENAFEAGNRELMEEAGFGASSLTLLKQVSLAPGYFSSRMDILLAREAHFPASIADLYEVKDGESKMPDDLREAHERNDEVLERIYIGRRFKNDTERLEKLFDLYTKMTASAAPANGRKRKAGANA